MKGRTRKKKLPFAVPVTVFTNENPSNNVTNQATDAVVNKNSSTDAIVNNLSSSANNCKVNTENDSNTKTVNKTKPPPASNSSQISEPFLNIDSSNDPTFLNNPFRCTRLITTK
jgi:hypothetical protein